MSLVPYLHYSHAIVTHPINQACSKETADAQFVSLLFYLDQPSTGARVERYDPFSFLILHSVRHFVCLWVQ